MKYDKIIRHHIPQIIEEQGGECIVEQIDIMSQEGKEYLKKKLIEETAELVEAVSRADILEEIADVMEVLGAFCAQEGVDLGKIFTIGEAKCITRGDFNKGGKYVILKESNKAKDN